MKDLVTSHKYHRNPASLRFGNVLLKSVFLCLAIICSLGITWKKKRHLIRARGNYNVITLNQTLLLVCLLSLDNILHTVLVVFREDLNLVFTLDILRIILIENIFFKILIPAYLLLQSRTHYKPLWAASQERKLNFFMTQPSFIPRPVVSKYQTNLQNQSVKSVMTEMPTSSRKLRDERPHHVTITFDTPDEETYLPSVY